MKKIIVAIDGYSSCGKSTIAKAMAKRLGYGYIDTGAMYRAVTLYFLDNGVELSDAESVHAALAAITIHFEQHPEKGNRTFLNGEDVEEKIRTMHISQSVSLVSELSEVRRAMVLQQQAMGERKGVVLEGRDIGTVVFPKAELKLFMTADVEVRTQRRYAELEQKGQSVSRDAVRENLQERDRIDTSREDSPLRQADDAVVIDNSNLTQEQQLEYALTLAQNVLDK